MIKFFRHIRKQLLTENKFSKYFLYAIGEIFLVVIGILIALQVNDWNENKKQENRKTEVTKSLVVELNNVLSYTEDQRNMMNDRIEVFTKILNEWETLDPKTIPKDSLSGYYFLIHTATLLKYNPRVDYYNSIISSGEIKLISDNLVGELNYIYEKHTKDVVTYVDQEVDLHILIAAVVAKNHSKVFLSASPNAANSPELFGLNVLDTTTTISFLKSIKGDGELKSLIFRNLTILKTKRALLTGRIIPDINNLIVDFESTKNAL